MKLWHLDGRRATPPPVVPGDAEVTSSLAWAQALTSSHVFTRSLGDMLFWGQTIGSYNIHSRTVTNALTCNQTIAGGDVRTRSVNNLLVQSQTVALIKVYSRQLSDTFYPISEQTGLHFASTHTDSGSLVSQLPGSQWGTWGSSWDGTVARMGMLSGPTPVSQPVHGLNMRIQTMYGEGDDKALSSDMVDGTTYTYGSPTDLHGLPLSPTVINDGISFGIKLGWEDRSLNGGPSIQINYLTGATGLSIPVLSAVLGVEFGFTWNDNGATADVSNITCTVYWSL